MAATRLARVLSIEAADVESLIDRGWIVRGDRLDTINVDATLLELLWKPALLAQLVPAIEEPGDA